MDSEGCGTAESKQSILGSQPEYLLEELMLKLVYFYMLYVIYIYIERERLYNFYNGRKLLFSLKAMYNSGVNDMKT